MMYSSMQDKVAKKQITLTSFGWVSLTAAFKRCETELGLDQDETWQLLRKAWRNERLQLKGCPKQAKSSIPIDPSWSEQVTAMPLDIPKKNSEGEIIGTDRVCTELPNLNEHDIIWFAETKIVPRYVKNVQVKEDDLNTVIKEVRSKYGPIYSGMKEPLIPYKADKALITMSEAKRRLCSAIGSDAWDESMSETFVLALRSQKVIAVAMKESAMYQLPSIFWAVSHNSSFSRGALHAFMYGIVDNMVDKDRIADLHTIQDWPIVIDSDSFEHWIKTDLQPQAISDYFESENYWNVIQALGWVMYRDKAIVYATRGNRSHFGTDWEDQILPSGKQLVEVDNAPPCMMILETWQHTQHPKKLSFSRAKEELIRLMRDGKFTAIARKNNIGDLEEMRSLDWKDADFFEESLGKIEKIYVAAKDHVTAIGRTKWYGVTFNKTDVIKQWSERVGVSEYIAKPSGAKRAESLQAVKIWLKSLIDNDNEKQKGTKDGHYRPLFRGEFPDTMQYSDRVFNDAWKALVPKTWSDGNAKKKNGKISRNK